MASDKGEGFAFPFFLYYGLFARHGIEKADEHSEKWLVGAGLCSARQPSVCLRAEQSLAPTEFAYDLCKILYR